MVDNVIEVAVNNDRRRRLEHELSTTFIAQQKERDPAERTRLWNKCLELVKEIEELSNGTTKTTTE